MIYIPADCTGKKDVTVEASAVEVVKVASSCPLPMKASALLTSLLSISLYQSVSQFGTERLQSEWIQESHTKDLDIPKQKYNYCIMYYSKQSCKRDWLAKQVSIAVAL